MLMVGMMAVGFDKSFFWSLQRLEKGPNGLAGLDGGNQDLGTRERLLTHAVKKIRGAIIAATLAVCGVPAAGSMMEYWRVVQFRRLSVVTEGVDCVVEIHKTGGVGLL